ncbi:MAG: thioredoxin-disulfide reductase [Calditrichaeota bacterium]|nr:thioredoxin-disulfide reductase [Candidatus Cloacimonadota bacterium]MCB1048788.1 thioredoxin-disulfide reductase [Calditrichota bacterium]MCB9474099.1 thioredoxin-disulfide reductase [Candidatus Delongbacteria bacterium]
MGGGPAGLTAALYTSRANLNPTLVEGMQPGGQLTITTEVENFPGFEHGIMGPELIDVMHKQVERFGTSFINGTVTRVQLDQRPFKLQIDDSEHTCDALIIATGASARLLGLPGEDTLMGYGLSACATCDGFFFRDREICVIGGGDSAMEEANFLTKFASKVTIIHRREEFRASAIMLERCQKNPKIEFLLNHAPVEFKGDPQNGGLKSVMLKHTQTGELVDFAVDGCFVAIGHVPNTGLFKGVLDMDATGYLEVQGRTTYTNVPGVFAAGDVSDHRYRQAISAAGSGCMAAIDAERWLDEQEG